MPATLKLTDAQATALLKAIDARIAYLLGYTHDSRDVTELQEIAEQLR
jgi:hypothetical protein